MNEQESLEQTLEREGLRRVCVYPVILGVRNTVPPPLRDYVISFDLVASNIAETLVNLFEKRQFPSEIRLIDASQLEPSRFQSGDMATYFVYVKEE